MAEAAFWAFVSAFMGLSAAAFLWWRWGVTLRGWAGTLDAWNRSDDAVGGELESVVAELESFVSAYGEEMGRVASADIMHQADRLRKLSKALERSSNGI